MKKPLENVKKPNFGPDFGLFTPNLESPKLVLEFYFHELLKIVPSYYGMQFKVKLMNEVWENDKKPNFGPDFGPFAPKLPAKIFSRVLPLLVVKHCSKLLTYAI